jgi:hypothetical protein
MCFKLVTTWAISALGFKGLEMRCLGPLLHRSKHAAFT